MSWRAWRAATGELATLPVLLGPADTENVADVALVNALMALEENQRLDELEDRWPSIAKLAAATPF